MSIAPIADIIIYTEELGSGTFLLLGGTQEGLDCLTRLYGPLAHGTTAAITGTHEELNAQLDALGKTGLRLKMWCERA